MLLSEDNMQSNIWPRRAVSIIPKRGKTLIGGIFKHPLRLIISSEEEMVQFGQEIALELKSGSVIALHGDLGAGKTTLAKGIISALASVPKEQVQSPTFTYLHIYDASLPIYHFDLYRLKEADDFLRLGFLDFLGAQGICLIEWPERINPLLPSQTIHLKLSHVGEGKRNIDVYKS